MSHDLNFLAPSGKNIAVTALREYFEKRQNYQINGQEANYENEDTGVYFTFDLRPTEPDDVNPWGAAASFNLNYYRPHIFGLEAEPEVSAFIQAFHFGIHDPQTPGMDNGPYSREGFLRGWNEGNERAYTAFIEYSDWLPRRYLLPGEVIERCWRWNYGRRALQQTFGEAVFIPRIQFLFYEHRLFAVAVWPDAIPIALPAVDLFVIKREELVPRGPDSGKLGIAILPASELEPLLAQYPLQDGPLPFRLVSYPRAPKNVVDWVLGLPDEKPRFQVVSVDCILNSEIADKIAST